MFALDGLIRRQIRSVIGDVGDANVEVKGGNITINDVHFDESVLEDAIFPPVDPALPPARLSLVHVKKLAIKIPWGNFSKGFVDVELDGLSVNLVRRPTSDVTVEDLRARKEACVAELMKQLVEQLMAMAASNKKNKKNKGRDSKADDGDDKKSDDDKGGGAGGGPPGFIKSAIRKVIEAFRPIVRITNVHIRYEDLEEDAVDLQERDAPLALGVTIGRLMLQHPDSPYSEIDEDLNMMPCKDVVPLEVNVDGLGVYMHTAAMGVESVIGGGPDAQRCARRAVGRGGQAAAVGQGEGAWRRPTARTTGRRRWARCSARCSRRRAAGRREWLIRPISVSGKVHVNTGLFIKARTAFDWPHLAVADLEVGPIQVQISGTRRRRC